MNKARFVENPHSYYLMLEDGTERKLTSVSELLLRQGITADYSAVSEAVLKAKAERGTLIHKEIQNYIENGEIGFTPEFGYFLKVMDEEGLQPLFSEMVFNDEWYAGTVDIIAFNDDSERVLIDIKTTATLHLDTVTWQTSVYKYLAEVNKLKIDKIAVLHLLPENGKLVYLTARDAEALICADRNSTVYVDEKAILPDAVVRNALTVARTLADIEAEYKAHKKAYEEMKEHLFAEMCKRDIKSFDNGILRVTRIDETTRASVDTGRLKTELPDIYEKYKNVTSVKGGVKITLREADL